MRARPNWLAGIFAGIWLVIVLIPVYVMLRAAFSSSEDFGRTGPVGLPNTPTLDNFRYSLEHGFGGFLGNSLIMTAGTVALLLVLVPPLSFALVRGQSRWTGVAFKIMLFGLAIPAQVVVIPLFFIIQKAGLYDTYLGVILPTVAFALPLTTVILTGSMREITNDLYEAMALDGAGALTVFRKLVLPLSRGGLATVVVYGALQAWNNYLVPLTLTRSEDLRVTTLGLGIFRKEFALNVPGLMSAVILSILPLLIVSIFARRSLVRGLMGVGGK